MGPGCFGPDKVKLDSAAIEYGNMHRVGFKGVDPPPSPPPPPPPIFIQNFIFMGHFGVIWNIWVTVFTLNIHTPYPLPYTSLLFSKFILLHESFWNCWVSGKQCRPWSDVAFTTSDLNLHCLLRPVCPNTLIQSNPLQKFFWIRPWCIRKSIARVGFKFFIE